MSGERVERVAAALAEWSKMNVVWDDPILEMAKVAVAALESEPPLEDVLRDGDVQRIMLYRIRHESPPRWSAYVQAGHCGPDDPQGIGIEGDPVVAIRAAVQRAKEQG